MKGVALIEKPQKESGLLYLTMRLLVSKRAAF